MFKTELTMPGYLTCRNILAFFLVIVQEEAEVGSNLRDFFLKGFRYKVHWCDESQKKDSLKNFQNFIRNVLFEVIS